jgi:rhamnosyltransferase
MDSATKGTRITALVVTYHPGPRFRDVVQGLFAQVDCIVIVDNSVDPTYRNYVQACCNGFPGALATGRLQIIWNKTNVGYPTAVNQAADLVPSEPDSLLFIADQDTLVSPGAIAELAHLHLDLSRSVKLGFVALRNVEGMSLDEISHGAKPNWFERIKFHYFRMRGCASSIETQEVIFSMNSGMLISRRVFHAVGGFNGSYFLDGSDEEFCLRLRQSDLRIFVALNVLAAHSCGEVASNPLASDGIVRISGHPPWRHFFIVRNNLATARAYFEGNMADTMALIFSVLAFTFLDMFVIGRPRAVLHEALRGFAAFLGGSHEGIVKPMHGD